MDQKNKDTVFVCQADDVICIGDNIRLALIGVNGRIARLGVAAPRHVSVHREEIFARIQAEKKAAADAARV